MKRLVPLAAACVLTLSALVPSTSGACPVCFSGSQRVRSAFYNTTVFMSLLPLGMIGGGLLWLRRRGRGILAGEFEERDAWSPDAAGPEAPAPTCDESTPSSPRSR
jgi:hypothetical protein